MSRISELGYSAGWMEGLEHALWAMILGGPRQYGRHVVSDDELSELLDLSRACGGWVRYDSVLEESYATVDDWQDIYLSLSQHGG